MTALLGMEAKVYKNDGTFAVPVWTELSNVKDATLTMEKSEADVTTRANQGWRAMMGALKEATLEFEMVWDTDDPSFNAIKDSFFLGTSIEMAAMDRDIAVPGASGLRAAFTVTNFSRSEPLEEAITVSVTMKVARSENPPDWLDVV